MEQEVQKRGVQKQEIREQCVQERASSTHGKPHMLLHCCCAPCASYVIEHLMPEYNISVLFFNPNIEPQDEYNKRKKELMRLLQNTPYASDVALIDCEYENHVFKDAVKLLRNEPEGGTRCRMCFELRLERTAAVSKAGGCDIFATTLSVSPHKNAKLLNAIGNQLSAEYGVEYLNSDFKKKNGYKHSVELSKRYKLYRQEYCGCKG